MLSLERVMLPLNDFSVVGFISFFVRCVPNDWTLLTNIRQWKGKNDELGQFLLVIYGLI